MHSVLEIYNRDRATYRDARTGSLNSIFGRVITLLTLATIATLVWEMPDAAVLRALLTVLGVILGFSFSVLFFLVSSPFQTTEEQSSLEDENRALRIKTLSDELFDNVSFFVLLVLGSLAACIIGVFGLDEVVRTLNGFVESLASEWEVRGAVFTLLDKAATWIRFLNAFLIWIGVFWSSQSLLRIIKRVSFLFSERLALQKAAQEK